MRYRQESGQYEVLKDMDSTKNNLLEQNIKVLENGITLKEYVEKEKQIKIDGDTRVYNQYGFYVVHNKTKNLYLLDGGNNSSGFTMSVTIPQFFITNEGCGNPYMHEHYMAGDVLVLTFWRYDRQKYNSMEQLKEYIEAYYDSIGETYYDYVMRMQDESYTKQNRPKDYNCYYSGKLQEKTQERLQESLQGKKTKSVAAALLRLENKSKFFYNLLNLIVDILIKPIPIFIWMLFENSVGLVMEENALQNTISFAFSIIAAYLVAILVYFSFLVFVQICKLFACTYKPLVIHFRVFDIIISLSKKRIRSGNDSELKDMLYIHERIVEKRKEKREDGKARAYERKKQRDERKKQRDIEKLEYAKKEYERAKESAQINRDSAAYNYKKAREGGTLFSSAETKMNEARRDNERAEYDERTAKYYEEKIRTKEQELGIKRK